MTSSRSDRSGFTTVELLITLFVAAVFLIAGFQLYDVIIRDSGETRAESRASNVAYDYLRRYSSSSSNPCSAQTPLSSQPIDIDGLSDVTVSVSITCPYSASGTTSLSKIEVLLNYNDPQKSVRHATYVDRSKG